MEVVQRVAGHYEAQDVEFGRVYRWCPECVVIDCDCGKRSIHKRMDIISGCVALCECGEDRAAAAIREELVLRVLDEEDEAVHPWRYDRDGRDAGIPY